MQVSWGVLEGLDTHERSDVMKSQTMRILVSALILAVLFPFSVGTGLGEELIKVGYIPVGDCLQLYVANDMGYFTEEGITVDKKPMKGGATIAAAVESGAIQIGWSNSTTIIIAHSKGFDFTYLTSGALEVEPNQRVHSLLVAEDSSIDQVSDLVGKKVAINTLGNINELSMIVLADENGVDGRKIQFVEVPFPNMEAALKNGSVDAVLSIEPFVTLSIAHGTAKYLEKSVHKGFGERFMIASWFAKKSWIEEHPKYAAAFARAINKASDYIEAHPDKVVDFLVKNTKLTSDLAGKITQPAFSSTFHKSDLQRMIDISAKYQFIDKPFKAEDIIYIFSQ